MSQTRRNKVADEHDIVNDDAGFFVFFSSCSKGYYAHFLIFASSFAFSITSTERGRKRPSHHHPNQILIITTSITICDGDRCHNPYITQRKIPNALCASTPSFVLQLSSPKNTLKRQIEWKRSSFSSIIIIKCFVRGEIATKAISFCYKRIQPSEPVRHSSIHKQFFIFYFIVFIHSGVVFPFSFRPAYA